MWRQVKSIAMFRSAIITMSQLERRHLPDWAARERAGDLSWLGENLFLLWPAARRSFAEHGRGALIVDTTTRLTGAGNPFAYLSEAEITELKEADASRMVKEYDPSWELIAILFKSKQRVSTYRIGVPAARAHEPIATN
jgi:hypothetical protein